MQLAFTDEALPPLAGEHTVESFSALVAEQPGYRPWGLESAALDLALRQAGLSLAEAVSREPRPVRFVVSQNALLGVARHLSGAAFQAGCERFVDGRRRGGAGRDRRGGRRRSEGSLRGRVGRRDADPPSSTVASRAPFPEAWLEDARLTDETRPVLEPHRDRLTWDFPIHSVADVDALAVPAAVPQLEAVAVRQRAAAVRLLRRV